MTKTAFPGPSFTLTSGPVDAYPAVLRDCRAPSLRL